VFSYNFIVIVVPRSDSLPNGCSFELAE